MQVSNLKPFNLQTAQSCQKKTVDAHQTEDPHTHPLTQVGGKLQNNTPPPPPKKLSVFSDTLSNQPDFLLGPKVNQPFGLIAYSKFSTLINVCCRFLLLDTI